MSKGCILVVDDEPSIVKFVGDSLRQEGYEVVKASDGEQALRAAEQTVPMLIILDIGLPKLNGFEVCQRIREWSHVPIIILSARLGEEDKVKALQLGSDDYLVKPFGISELIARVEAVLRRTGHHLKAPPMWGSRFMDGGSLRCGSRMAGW
ncbi:MAG: response regulator [Dehalococcoidia bacterium]|nr:response regulator [Dehalococcoidia bacterium]